MDEHTRNGEMADYLMGYEANGMTCYAVGAAADSMPAAIWGGFSLKEKLAIMRFVKAVALDAAEQGRAIGLNAMADAIKAMKNEVNTNG